MSKYSKYIPTHLLNWVRAPALVHPSVDDSWLESAVIIDATRLVRYLLDRDVRRTPSTLLKKPLPNLPLKYQKPSSLLTDGYSIFDEGQSGYAEVSDSYSSVYQEVRIIGSSGLVAGTARTVTATSTACLRIVPANEIMLQIAARYGSNKVCSLIFRDVTFHSIEHRIVAAAEAACLYYCNKYLLKMLHDRFPMFRHVELAGYCRNYNDLAAKIKQCSLREYDGAAMQIAKTIAARDDLEMMICLTECVPVQHFIDMALLSSVTGNAIRILTHYVRHNESKIQLCLHYACRNPGAALDWFWEHKREITKKSLNGMLMVSLGILNYHAILWCAKHGALPSESDLAVLEQSIIVDAQRDTSENRSAVAEIRQICDATRRAKPT